MATTGERQRETEGETVVFRSLLIWRLFLSHIQSMFLEENFPSSIFVFVFNKKTQLLVLITDPKPTNLASL